MLIQVDEIIFYDAEKIRKALTELNRSLKVIQDREEYWGNRGWIHWFRNIRDRFF